VGGVVVDIIMIMNYIGAGRVGRRWRKRRKRRKRKRRRRWKVGKKTS
jgi:hypothetical protein